jgi:hypothetical protein
MNIKIQPKHIELNEVLITSISVNLDKTAYITGLILGTEISKPFNINLTKEEYDGWGNDDNYITELILTKLGLEKA